MKKLLFICLLTVAFSFTSHAQQRGDIQMSIGAEGAFPIGDWSNGYNIGIGASTKGLYSLSDAGQIGLHLGWIRFGMKTESDDDISGSMSIIPVLGLYRHYFGNLYVEPQVGFSISKTKVSFSGGDDFGIGGSFSSTSLGYPAGVGYLLGNIEVSAQYQGFSQGGASSGFAGLRIAYSFPLR